ncbi:hypothetical protein ACFXO9_29815 [Nocardia tengchongensis]|uniref:hypothetical protein n=1 Tax=Nocardia tengchongensis TaxID=2055889 RepID=UPI0036BB6F61
MAGFLILYRRHSGERQVVEYDGPEGDRDALRERLRLEAEHRFEGEDVEIAVISSDSLATVMVTHSRYFNGREVDLLGGI